MSVVVAEPAPPATRGLRMVAPMATIGGLALATLALHLRDPHQHGTWGLCPFKVLTGLNCPGCGGLRAVNDLTNGHLGAAVSSNLLVVSLMPVAILALALWATDRWRGEERRLPRQLRRPAFVAFVVVVVVFTVCRNLAFGAWLAP
jgi:Protein of unknown function (DUF2752)